MPIRWINKEARMRIRCGERESNPSKLFCTPGNWAYAAHPVNYLRVPHLPGMPVEIKVTGLAIVDCSVEAIAPVADFHYTVDTVR